MPGIKKTFVFMPVRNSVVLERKWACWCYSCMHASAPGAGTASDLVLKDQQFVCKGCTSGLTWKETAVQRTDPAGVANARAKTLAHARDLAKQLKCKLCGQSNQPIWVAVQNRGENDPDQYWIGKAVGVPKEYGPGESGSNGRTRYGPGDMEIEVQWFHRDISGGDERRIFRRWVADEEAGDQGPEEGTKYTFNSVELRAIDVKMQPVLPLGGVPLETVAQEVRPQRSAAAAAVEHIRNILFTAHRHRAQPAEQLWEIPAGEESAILLHCC